MVSLVTLTIPCLTNVQDLGQNVSIPDELKMELEPIGESGEDFQSLSHIWTYLEIRLSVSLIYIPIPQFNEQNEQNGIHIYTYFYYLYYVIHSNQSSSI